MTCFLVIFDKYFRYDLNSLRTGGYLFGLDENMEEPFP